MPFHPIGSLWRKWDLHFHTPASYDYQRNDVTNEQIVDGLISGGIAAVAITDHHTIDVKRIKSLQILGAEKLTVFPGIELRSELGGSESVHLIGIFPELADSEFLWTKIQGSLCLTPGEVSARGDDRVYIHFREAAQLIHDLGGYVSVHVGRKANSIERIGNEYPYKQAFKEDLAREYIDLFEVGRLLDVKAYREIVFPEIGFERPLIICSDNHNILNYALKAPCWIKADPAFNGFQQVKSDPQERVYIGDVPPAVERVQNNSTKYLRSISFDKTPGSNLQEDWFSGSIPLNPGLIAVIGNKGTGKTALVESIGLLGNTAQHNDFSFLNASKFRQPKNNKAKHFQAKLEWQDGHSCGRLLSDSVPPDALEVVGYIPQHYLEVICNEIRTVDSRFDQELKSVIFSHVADADRLGKETLDGLLQFLTEQTRARLTQLRAELSEINGKTLKLQKEGSEESKQLLLQLVGEKTRELEAHEKTRPVEVQRPETDPAKQVEFRGIAEKIEQMRSEKASISNELKQKEADQKSSALRQAIADRILSRLDNFESQYETFVEEALADCKALGLDPRDLVKIEFYRQTPTQIRLEAQAAGEASRVARSGFEARQAGLQNDIEALTQQLDAPNVQYQRYLEELHVWENRRAEIAGDQEQAGSVASLQKQLHALADIPGELAQSQAIREAKVRSIYKQLEHLVGTYKTLYHPVQKFIENHDLATGKFTFEFEASIICTDLAEKLFALLNQARKGSFYGSEEGRKALKALIDTADFDSEDGAIKFVATLYDHLTHDKREAMPPHVPIGEQLKHGATELDVLNLVFSLSYLTPRYTLKWAGKSIEELSPGERGTLLLIFYLLIDRRDCPLIIDQPEENVDNQTVYGLLVPCIKEARKQRQVIIVTHNPNLAVVCDADQIIHCSIEKQARNRVTYVAGALENPDINRFTIDVLEGTRPAFDRRDSKYQEEGLAP
jgi:ABC-type lipoprotein export system ATPase subunit